MYIYNCKTIHRRIYFIQLFIVVIKTCTTLCKNCLMPLTGINCVIAWLNNCMYHNHLFFIKTTGSRVFLYPFSFNMGTINEIRTQTCFLTKCCAIYSFRTLRTPTVNTVASGLLPLQSYMIFYNMNICTYHRCFVGNAKICTQFHTKNAMPLPWVSTQLVNQGRKQAVENITATSHEGKGVSNKRKFACLLKSLCWLT